MSLKDVYQNTVTSPHPSPRRVEPEPPHHARSELIVTPLAGKRVRPVKYLVPGRIPAGKLILCGARGGSGKSTLWRSIAADLSAGRCALGMEYDNPVCAKVLIIAAEDGIEDTVLPGLLAERANVSRIAIIEGVRTGDRKSDFMLTPDHVGLVRDRLAQSPDIKLVILDPIASFIGRAKVDDHRASELRLLLDPLSELAESTGVTIVMIAHLNKSTGDAVDRFAGSAAYRDTVRAAYLVCPDPDDETRRLLVPAKENLPGFLSTSVPFGLAPLGATELDQVVQSDAFRGLSSEDLDALRAQLRRVKFDPARSVDPNEAMKAKKGDGTKVQRCKEWLKQFLEKYAYPSKEILDAAKVAGFTFDNLKEAKAQLKTEGVITHNNERFSTGVWWSGPGLAVYWIPRPEPFPTTPHSSPPPSSTSLSREREREIQSGELGTTGEWFGDGGSSPVIYH